MQQELVTRAMYDAMRERAEKAEAVALRAWSEGYDCGWHDAQAAQARELKA